MVREQLLTPILTPRTSIETGTAWRPVENCQGPSLSKRIVLTPVETLSPFRKQPVDGLNPFGSSTGWAGLARCIRRELDTEHALTPS